MRETAKIQGSYMHARTRACMGSVFPQSIRTWRAYGLLSLRLRLSCCLRLRGGGSDGAVVKNPSPPENLFNHERRKKKKKHPKIILEESESEKEEKKTRQGGTFPLSLHTVQVRLYLFSSVLFALTSPIP